MKKATMIKILLIPWASMAAYICLAGWKMAETAWQGVLILLIEVLCMLVCWAGLEMAEQTKEDDREILRLRRKLMAKK